MIRVKRIYDPSTPGDGLRVLVDRIWPRGLSKGGAKVDLWLKEIAPSSELRKWFDHDPTKWREFCERYNEELEDCEREVKLLRAEAEDGTLTLLFSARATEHNNAVALKALLERPRRSLHRR